MRMTSRTRKARSQGVWFIPIRVKRDGRFPVCNPTIQLRLLTRQINIEK